MLVKGNSGFGVELLDELTIRKSSPRKGADRLKRQIEKQKAFYDRCSDKKVRTPKVFGTSDNEESFSADMEFIAARDFVQFLSEADRDALDEFSGTIVDFIEANVSSSRETEVSRDIRSKLEDLSQRGVPDIYVEAAERSCCAPIVVPVGPCHGDLTLSNILFKGNSLYLIDFLDCYVESPLQDTVKLRQDTCFDWSLQLYQADFNRTRVRIALRYLDRRIETAFARYSWYHQYYELFQFVNMMRVLPYCVEPSTTGLATRALDAMVSKFTTPALP